VDILGVIEDLYSAQNVSSIENMGLETT